MSKGRTLPLCALALLTACHGDSNQAPMMTSVTHIHARTAKRGPTLEELTAGMVEAATVGKSTVPVAMKFDVTQRPVVGQPLEITVAVMPQVAADLAVLAPVAGEGLTLVPAPQDVEMPAVEPAQVYRHNIKVIPTVEGVQLLSLSLSLKHDEITETRTFSVPVIVAAAPEATAAKH